MEKLYKRLDDSVLYQEAWIEDGLLYRHWGIVGQRGERATRPMRFLENKKKAIHAALEDARRLGYEEIPLEEHATLLIEFSIDGFGSDADLEKRYALEDRMDVTLGWTGIGHCDGGSSGGNTMEVCCYVIDFELARKVIVEDLANTLFCDYSRIYREDD